MITIRQTASSPDNMHSLALNNHNGTGRRQVVISLLLHTDQSERVLTRYDLHRENGCSEPNQAFAVLFAGCHKTRPHAGHHSHQAQNLDYREYGRAEYPGLTRPAPTR